MRKKRSIEFRSTHSSRLLSCCLLAAAVTLSTSVKAQTVEDVLFSFNETDGKGPTGTLLMDSAGNLYGTTVNSTPTANCPYGCGNVFKLTRSTNGTWTQTILHSFTGGSDGYGPFAGVTFDTEGNLYGTTFYGGNSGCHDGYGNIGCGTVFKLTPNKSGKWIEIILYRFKGESDGTGPNARVIFDTHGNLYGAALNGGGSQCECGNVYKLTPTLSGPWLKSTLHTFKGTDGKYPYGNLTFDKLGNLYGTTSETVFALRLIGQEWKFETLYSFQNQADGGLYDGVVLDPEGNLYGSATGGSVLFQLSRSKDGTWKQNILYQFQTAVPESPLVFDRAGNLYGTVTYGGPESGDEGGVFELTPQDSGQWTLSWLVGFSGPNGHYPTYSGLIFDSKANLYGVTTAGGTDNDGVVFELQPTATQ